jgi:hypothetical protein
MKLVTLGMNLSDESRDSFVLVHAQFSHGSVQSHAVEDAFV